MDLGIEGIYRAQHWRGDNLLKDITGHNGIVLDGKDNLLEVYFANTSFSAHSIGLIADGFTPDDANDSLSDVTTSYEFTDYTGGTPKTWLSGIDATSTESDGGTDYVYIENGSYVEFAITAASETNVYGIYVKTASGVLWSTAAFSGGNIAVNNGDTLKIKYKVRIAY